MSENVECIYILSDPRTGTIYYVGRTINPSRRLWQHIHDARFGVGVSERRKWITSLLDSGIKPSMIVLTRVSTEYGKDVELEWIEKLYLHGCPLVNQEVRFIK